ncbi:MAG: hypothetical protein JWR72_3010 [Flavisolibacter sp.]|jgi:hypothetical protein|nr:hypothetical protein [Flavisolibacter sp.]
MYLVNSYQTSSCYGYAYRTSTAYKKESGNIF